MKKLLAIFFWLCTLSTGEVFASSVPDFALIDQNGRFYQLSRFVDQRVVVVLAFQRDSDSGQSGLAEFVSLSRRYQGAPVQFMVLVADSSETRESLKEFSSSLGTEIPFLLDKSQLIADALSVRSVGEVLVIDPLELAVLYRGDVGLFSNSAAHQALAANLPGVSSYLHYVVHSILRNENFTESPVLSEGPLLDLDKLIPHRAVAVSFETQVAPILIQRCVSCHKSGGMAPWAMDSHLMVQGWSKMIRETLLTRRMPPGQIDPAFASSYVDVHHITDEEMSLLIAWIDSGAQRDENQVDPLGEILPDASSWALGEPDLIIDFPEQTIPATGVLEYVFVPLDIGLTEDRWVSAYEFDVGDKAALHHIILYTQDSRQRRQNASGGGSRTNFGGYAPGREYVVLDAETGIFLKRDMRFMIQFHYTAVGREVLDKSRLGLYFRDTPPKRELVRTAVMNGDFVIPPGAREFPVSASTLISKDSYLYSFAPHMHFRGKHIRFSARYPDGGHENLLSIPNFQHNWQMVYRLRDPVFLPAGTEIVAEGAFDNSRYNPMNPDAGQAVSWGDQVWDEMFITWMRIAEAQQP